MFSFFKKNCCDGIYKSFDVHFTGICDNRCPYCIDKTNNISKTNTPDWEAIANTILENKDRINDVLILGGEPLLFPVELCKLIEKIKKESNLMVYVTTSMPYIAYEKKNLTFDLLEMMDGLNISVHHMMEDKADSIRGTKSKYDRDAFYFLLPNKQKIRINLNLVKGILDQKWDIQENVKFYNDFGSIKLNELQNSPEFYVSFEEIFKVKLPTPYFHGCQHSVKQLFQYQTNNNVILKRSCFLVETSRKAGILDGVKAISKKLIKADNADHVFGVVLENGQIKNSWN